MRRMPSVASVMSAMSCAAAKSSSDLRMANLHRHSPAWKAFDGLCGARGTTSLVRFVSGSPLPFDFHAPPTVSRGEGALATP